MENLTGIPYNIDEAVDTLLAFYRKIANDALEQPEEAFTTFAHYTIGVTIRDAWHMWWREGHEYPSWKPNIVAYFNDMGITHADDMSHIILTCLHRNVNDRPYNLLDQVQHFREYWKEEGHEDGIYNDYND